MLEVFFGSIDTKAETQHLYSSFTHSRHIVMAILHHVRADYPDRVQAQHTVSLVLQPAGLVVAGNWLTSPRQRGHLAFPCTGTQQQNATAQHLAQHALCISYLYTYKRKYIPQSRSQSMPQ